MAKILLIGESNDAGHSLEPLKENLEHAGHTVDYRSVVTANDAKLVQDVASSDSGINAIILGNLNDLRTRIEGTDKINPVDFAAQMTETGKPVIAFGYKYEPTTAMDRALGDLGIKTIDALRLQAPDKLLHALDDALKPRGYARRL